MTTLVFRQFINCVFSLEERYTFKVGKGGEEEERRGMPVDPAVAAGTSPVTEGGEGAEEDITVADTVRRRSCMQGLASPPFLAIDGNKGREAPPPSWWNGAVAADSSRFSVGGVGSASPGIIT